MRRIRTSVSDTSIRLPYCMVRVETPDPKLEAIPVSLVPIEALNCDGILRRTADSLMWLRRLRRRAGTLTG